MLKESIQRLILLNYLKFNNRVDSLDEAKREAQKVIKCYRKDF